MQQNVDSQGRPLSGWWRRALGFLTDSLLATLLALFVGGVPAFILWVSDISDVAGGLWMVVGSLAAVIGYAIYLPVRWNGQTPGKKLACIRIVRLDGNPIEWKTMWIRYGLMQYAPSFLANFFTPLWIIAAPYFLLDYLFPLWDKERQCLHDKAAKTQVIFEGPQPSVSPGWHDDPSDPSRLRYFDGSRWTDQTAEKSGPSFPATWPPDVEKRELDLPAPEKPEGAEEEK